MTIVLHALHLYPDEMNTYGDRGNLLCLVRRAEWHGIKLIVHYYHAGTTLPKQIDLVLGGGGQDAAQSDIQADILRIGHTLHKAVEDDVPMLLVCGMYQLFGNRFITSVGDEITGIGVFNIETLGSKKRLIGNTAVQTTDFGMLYGFENHSGRTYLRDGQTALGTVARGNGNNGEDQTEGARTRNAIGTYLHGPLLPTNPLLADGLLSLALARQGKVLPDTHHDDSLTEQVRITAAHRKY